MILNFLKYSLLFVFSFSLLYILSACRQEQPEQEQTSYDVSYTEEHSSYETATTATTIAATSYKNNSDAETYIILDNEKTTVNGPGVTFENNTVTITEAGIYHFTGTLSDGKIYINSNNENKKVKLYLEGVNISCSTDAPLFIENSPDETVLILASSTENYFSDTARTIAEGSEDYATAAIYSKDDLQIEGDGSLTVNGNFNKGIFSKNDIDIHGGNIKINSVDDGIRGKESVEIDDGIIDIVSGGDGIRTNEETDAEKGRIEINDGTITITSSLDGIQATGALTVNGGNINITSGGGSSATTSYSNKNNYVNNMSFPFGGKHPDSSFSEESAVNTPSAKGIKSDTVLALNGGSITIDSSDDSIHAPDVNINNCSITASTDDDGIHADEKVDISGGSININRSYEGIEGKIINISAGEIFVTSSDDGFNSASDSTDETDRNGKFGRMGGMGGMFENDESCIINVSGGFILVNADGDGIDSNGSINMTAGKMIVFGPTSNGNGALDYAGHFNISGGTLFASGSPGMAQSATGNGVRVLNFNCNGSSGSFYAFTDESGNCKLAFTAPKNFRNVVFASDSLSYNGKINFSQGGSVSSQNESIMGIYFDGTYNSGTVINSLS